MVWRSPCRRTAEQSISQPSAERLVHEPHCPDYQVSTSTDCQQVTNAGPVVVTGVLPADSAAPVSRSKLDVDPMKRDTYQ